MVEKLTLENLDSGAVVTLDKETAPGFILDYVNWGNVKGEKHTYKYINQIGETVVGTSVAIRPITIEGWVVPGDLSDLRRKKRFLNLFVNPEQCLRVTYKTYSLDFLPDCTIRYASSYENNNDSFCKFQIQGTCYNPLFQDKAENRITFANVIPQFKFPLIISSNLPDKGVVFGKRSPSLISSILNTGSISVGMNIVFRAEGSVRNPFLIDIGSQEKIQINKLLSKGEEVVINTSIGEKSIMGGLQNSEKENYFRYWDLDNSWLQLKVGKNLFRYGATEGISNLNIFVSFSNKYLEVEDQ